VGTGDEGEAGGEEDGGVGGVGDGESEELPMESGRGEEDKE
jgi:hypothetical protein